MLTLDVSSTSPRGCWCKIAIALKIPGRSVKACKRLVARFDLPDWSVILVEKVTAPRTLLRTFAARYEAGVSGRT